MEQEKRRREILDILRRSQPVTGAELAARLGVSRQVVVQDIALLRARGENILATPQGYLIPQVPTVRGRVRTFVCRHGLPELEKELLIMVENGGRVLDVVVEHPVYGELSGMLLLSRREEVQAFAARLLASGAQPLASLTGGVHLHTVEAADEAALDRIEQELAAAGVLFLYDAEARRTFLAAD